MEVQIYVTAAQLLNEGWKFYDTPKTMTWISKSVPKNSSSPIPDDIKGAGTFGMTSSRPITLMQMKLTTELKMKWVPYSDWQERPSLHQRL